LYPLYWRPSASSRQVVTAIMLSMSDGTLASPSDLSPVTPPPFFHTHMYSSISPQLTHMGHFLTLPIMCIVFQTHTRCCDSLATRRATWKPPNVAPRLYYAGDTI
jgi:hypothetical protein